MKLISSVIMVCTLIVFISCTSTREITEVKKRVVVPQVIEDSLIAELSYSKTDSLKSEPIILAEQIVKGDTTAKIEFYPDPQMAEKIKELKKEKEALGEKLSKLGKFKFKVTPDTIVLFNTLKRVEIKENIIETPFTSKLGFVLIGMVICGVVGFIIKIKS